MLCLSLQAFASLTSFEANVHQHEYDEAIESTHDNHDNIDDKHSHTHKHSESDEEHEHKHEHSKMVQNDFEWITYSSRMTTSSMAIDIFHGFRERDLISDHYPFDIFRPPIF